MLLRVIVNPNFFISGMTRLRSAIVIGLIGSFSSAGALAQEADPSTIEMLIQQNAELRERIEKLEAAASTSDAEKESEQNLAPKNGLYVQADIGGQFRDFAGEDGDTVTYFKRGFYGSAGIGYRFSENFRMSAEYANQSSDVDKVSADYGFETTLNGRPLPGMGAITLNQYTLNAYYDVPGFGYRKRIRPYAGVGVGVQKSSIMGLSNDFASTADLYAWGETWVPLLTLQAGASYVVNENTEIYAGGKYSQGAEMLFRGTDFGNILPQSSKNWSVSGGVRYTF